MHHAKMPAGHLVYDNNSQLDTTKKGGIQKGYNSVTATRHEVCEFLLFSGYLKFGSFGFRSSPASSSIQICQCVQLKCLVLKNQ